MKKINYNIKINTSYSELYNSLYASLCLFANKYTGNLEKSKDLVQEVYIKVWNHKILLEKEEEVKSYLYTSVRNKCLDYLKSKEFLLKSNSKEVDLILLESDSYFEKEVLIEEVSRTVNTALKTLPEKCREIVELSMKGHQNNQIAEELSISINTVKTQKKIAYTKLRPLLKECYAPLLLLLLNL